MPDYKPGQSVDGWRLLERIGPGGNATVWKAQRPDHVAALKLLHTVRPESEPFQRFRREIETLRTIGDLRGVLPVLDAYLPASGENGRQPWLAMPIATPLRVHLGRDAKIDECIRAIASIADTLAKLQEQFGLAHRDIKPDNLYWHEGTYCVGDFGLVELPDSAALTKEGRRLGARHYQADEILLTPDKGPPYPADVYGLAKTLWVLLTGHDVPIQGTLLRSQQASRVTSYAPDDRLHSVELLLERATQFEPANRGSMRDFASELGAWLQHPATEVGKLNVDSLRAALRPAVERHINIFTAHAGLFESRSRITADIENRLRQLAADIAEILGLQCDLRTGDGVPMGPGLVALASEYHCIHPRHIRLSVGSHAPLRTGRPVLLVGELLYMLTDAPERVVLGACYSIVDMHRDKSTDIWLTGRSVVPGSADERNYIAELIEGLYVNAAVVTKAFVDRLP